MDDYVMPKKPKPSEKYLELIEAYKHLHEDDTKFQGISLIPFAIDIYDIIRYNDCKSILDYGCGKGYPYKEQYKYLDRKKKIPNFDKPLHLWWGVEDLFLYDPGVPEHNKLPTKWASRLAKWAPSVHSMSGLGNTSKGKNFIKNFAKNTFGGWGGSLKRAPFTSALLGSPTAFLSTLFYSPPLGAEEEYEGVYSKKPKFEFT